VFQKRCVAPLCQDALACRVQKSRPRLSQRRMTGMGYATGGASGPESGLIEKDVQNGQKLRPQAAERSCSVDSSVAASGVASACFWARARRPWYGRLAILSGQPLDHRANDTHNDVFATSSVGLTVRAGCQERVRFLMTLEPFGPPEGRWLAIVALDRDLACFNVVGWSVC